MAGTVVIDPRVAALMAKFEEEEGEMKQEQQLPKANLPKNLEEFLAAEKLVVNATFQQYFSYIMVVSFIHGGNRSIERKLPTCRKSLTNFIT